MARRAHLITAMHAAAGNIIIINIFIIININIDIFINLTTSLLTNVIINSITYP